MNNTKKILIVTHQFIPHQSPRTTRWKLLYDELIELGYDVTVITGTSQLSEDPNIKYIGNKKASGIVKNLRTNQILNRIQVIKIIYINFLRKFIDFFINFLHGQTIQCFGYFLFGKIEKKLI
tara:strand:- start:1050 stop:1415 length:366 start_codon:yes stop_codon:yes gene_type:complete